MGFHHCGFCPPDPVVNTFGNLSSGDVNLTFANGNRWVMPDMILHYVADHGWRPPQKFIEDVMNGEYADSGRAQTCNMTINEIMRGERVGYLADTLEEGEVPPEFIDRLEQLMKKAGSDGNRAQTKGLSNLR